MRHHDWQGAGRVLRVLSVMQGALLQDTPRPVGGPPPTNEGYGLEHCRGALVSFLTCQKPSRLNLHASAHRGTLRPPGNARCMVLVKQLAALLSQDSCLQNNPQMQISTEGLAAPGKPEVSSKPLPVPWAASDKPAGCVQIMPNA